MPRRRCKSMKAQSDKLAADPEPAPEKRALVIGGGIAGIQAALDLANARIRVTLVEKSPSLGGRMAQLDKTFPTMDCSI
ncbi:MAG: FAD-dependent oxidoreductase [Phycisphaerales bacterium]|nr:MAG: FAD-dependent oxidoreductase [Phycisphaerales bacterium]